MTTHLAFFLSQDLHSATHYTLSVLALKRLFHVAWDLPSHCCCHNSDYLRSFLGEWKSLLTGLCLQSCFSSIHRTGTSSFSDFLLGLISDLDILKRFRRPFSAMPLPSLQTWLLCAPSAYWTPFHFWILNLSVRISCLFCTLLPPIPRLLSLAKCYFSFENWIGVGTTGYSLLPVTVGYCASWELL